MPAATTVFLKSFLVGVNLEAAIAKSPSPKSKLSIALAIFAYRGKSRSYFPIGLFYNIPQILSQKLGLPLPTNPEKGYNKLMINWSTDEKEFKKKNPQEYKLWRLTQLINYGLDGEKLDRKEVKIAWTKIKDQLDPHKAVYLEYLLWDKKPSSPQFNENFWNLSKRKTT